MRNYTVKVFAFLIYFVLMVIDYVVGRNLYSNKMDAGKLLLFKNFDFSIVQIIPRVHLYFSISYEYYFLDKNDYLVDDGGEIWKELEQDGIIKLNEKRAWAQAPGVWVPTNHTCTG